jgi:NADPH:quinone reductase-like Zn-dependent oxidoreductase
MKAVVSRAGHIDQLWIEDVPTAPVPGTDFAGIVERVGSGVTTFRPGDEVFGSKRGSLAEYLCCAADGVVTLKPPSISLEEAAAVPLAGTTALQAVRDHGVG